MSIDKFIDSHGLLDKRSHPDGGDTCQREGMYFSLLGMQGLTGPRYPFVMKELHVADGVFLRHSNPDYDASDWDRMSRDQFQPMVIAAGYMSRVELNKIFRGHLGRGFLFTNNTRRNGATKKNHGLMVAGEVRNYNWKLPDLTGPEIWGNFIRAYNFWPLYPLLLLLDLELFLGALKWRFYPSHNITMNHTLSLFQALDRMPTPLSILASYVMPVPRLVRLLGEHFMDFQDDMVFFKSMFKDAFMNIKLKRKVILWGEIIWE